MTLNEGYSYRHVLGPTAVGHTAASYLASEFEHSSLAEWEARLRGGEVLLDDRKAIGSESLRAGQILMWNRPGWIEEETPQSYGMIYRDQHLIVVDKPSGLPTIPGGGFYVNTLLSRVRLTFPSARPLHRLGRATSGLVLFALDAHTASALTRNWTKVSKHYQALGSGLAEHDEYDINAPIGLCEHPRLRKVHAVSLNGKAAQSVARVLARRDSETVFEVDLHTGRPHQIRIHLASIGHPLVGDPLYGVGGVPRADQPGLPGDAGYWLHAKRLSFDHPHTGERLRFQSPLPDRLRVS